MYAVRQMNIRTSIILAALLAATLSAVASLMAFLNGTQFGWIFLALCPPFLILAFVVKKVEIAWRNDSDGK
jgi:hypothetical protein